MINYIIIDISELDLVDFDVISNTSKDTLNYSNDGTKTIIKWIGDEPAFISNLQTKSNIFNNSEILDILNQPEWIITSGTTLN